jgi:sterol desaturase/sphingolipid hydroxylase (fatty acid hydroxylase superfamily)
MSSALIYALAIPAFCVLMGLELLVLHLQGQAERYRFHDAITNLSCGMGQVLVGTLCKTALLAGYVFVWERWSLWTIPTDSLAAWIGVLVGLDLCYYLFHRAGHRINAVWAGHIVHHQSEEYNLSVALRQSWFVQLMGWAFYLPLAVLGFPPLMYVVMGAINTLYQFWIHTSAVGKLGPLEWVLNTPSHHRVHHGINPAYIDRNYAGIFIVWDRLFGTFSAEEEEPVYGVVKPLASWNPWWANLHAWVDMARLARRCARWRDALRVPLMPPEWRPADLGGDVTIPEVTRETRPRYGLAYGPRPTSLTLDAYLGLCTVATVGATGAILAFQGDLTQLQLYLSVGLALLTMIGWGALIEHRRWAIPFELARLAGLATAGVLAFGLPAWIAGGAAVGLAAWVLVGAREREGQPANDAEEARAPLERTGAPSGAQLTQGAS